MVKISYEAGHGISTPGKRTPDDEREWSFNNEVATAFAAELSKYEGVELKRFDDPTGKRDVPLQERSNGANAWGSDYHISFHHNAYTGKWGNWTGVETYTYNNASSQSVALANAVHPAVVKGYGLANRGIKKANYHILRETKMPSILIEGGFMDSTIDVKVLRDKSKLRNVGQLIAEAVAKFLKLKLKTTPTTTPKPTPNPTPTPNPKPTVPKNNLQVSRKTMRQEAIKEITAAVADGRFTSKHEGVEQYGDEELLNYLVVALARRT